MMNRRQFLATGTAGIAGIPVLATERFDTGVFRETKSPGTNSKQIPPVNDILAIPPLMNMGFHYTRQYSRRARINVMGLVDQSTDEWERWYLKTHEPEALKKMADAGYKLIEIHFMYGFGLEGEKPEYELTKKMAENAHRVGLKVLGYFQFFSVQKELFFIENPWAKDCLQLKADGTPYTYAYNRPALCFSHPQVQEYYLKGVETGLTYCNLDGIRLDNDYYKGCFCENCRKEFRTYLKGKFNMEEARRVFGFEQLDEISFVPDDLSKTGTIQDPVFIEMVRFRMLQRQKMMKLLRDKVDAVKPGAILGGNPAICRTLNDSSRTNLYLPDLGETHDLVCAENALFPARTGDSIRHQVTAYKHGQANHFKVFPSHHLSGKNGKTRWPENREECALSLCEALAFGGHVPCTTWGIRMDSTEDKILWERPYFLDALFPLRDFLNRHGAIYQNATPAAEVGIYTNRETHICDTAFWYSLQGIIQLLLRHKIPFRFVDTDDDRKLEGIQLLLVGNVRLVSDSQFERFRRFAGKNKMIVTGESFRFDEYFLRRDDVKIKSLLTHKNILYLPDRPEKTVAGASESSAGLGYSQFSLPTDGDSFMKAVRSVYDAPVKVTSSPFVAIDQFRGNNDEEYIHILNYDNTSPQDVEVVFDKVQKTNCFSPQNIGFEDFEETYENNRTRVRIKRLHTYAVLKAEAK